MSSFYILAFFSKWKRQCHSLKLHSVGKTFIVLPEFGEIDCCSVRISYYIISNSGSYSAERKKKKYINYGHPWLHSCIAALQDQFVYFITNTKVTKLSGNNCIWKHSVNRIKTENISQRQFVLTSYLHGTCCGNDPGLSKLYNGLLSNSEGGWKNLEGWSAIDWNYDKALSL